MSKVAIQKAVRLNAKPNAQRSLSPSPDQTLRVSQGEFVLFHEIFLLSRSESLTLSYPWKWENTDSLIKNDHDRELVEAALAALEKFHAIKYTPFPSFFCTSFKHLHINLEASQRRSPRKTTFWFILSARMPSPPCQGVCETSRSTSG